MLQRKGEAHADAPKKDAAPVGVNAAAPAAVKAAVTSAAAKPMQLRRRPTQPPSRQKSRLERRSGLESCSFGLIPQFVF